MPTQRFLLLALILCSQVLGVSSALAQTEPDSVNRFIELAQKPDLAAYPRVAVFTRIVDDSRRAVPGLTPAALTLEEDGRPIVDFSLEPAAQGLHVAFVIDPGPDPKRVGETGQATLEEARAVVRLFANEYMRQGDTVAVWSNAAGESIAVQPTTGAVSELSAGLDALSLQPSPVITPAIEAALDSLTAFDASAASQRQLIVLSPGWRGAPDPGLIQRLDAAGIIVNAVETRRGLDLGSSLAQLVSRAASPGLFVHYTGPEAVRSLYGAWNAARDGYRLTYNSPTGSAGQHQLGLRLTTETVGVAVAATLTYLAPVPAGPRIAFTSHQAGFDVGRLKTELIGVSVETAPGSPIVDEAELFVNGDSLGALSGSGPFAWVWEPAGFGQQLAAEGENVGPVELRVVVTDSTGQTTSTAIQGQARFDVIEACTAYRGVPGVGLMLYAFCRSSGLTPLLLVLILLVVAMAIGFVWLWRHRGAVSSAGQQMGRRLTDVYRRLTQTGRRRTPLAYLDAIEGLDPGARNSFEVFGETPIGRSHDYAELCFHAERQRSPISGLHCTLHEDEGGGWSLEDEDSTNGTYVNGIRLPGLGQRVPLHDGDVIELAQVERGGMKFRFRLASTAPGNATTSNRRGATHETRPLQRGGALAAEPELEFDPRRHDF